MTYSKIDGGKQIRDASVLSTKLSPWTSDLDANGYQIDDLGAPSDDAHAATKKYVDDAIGGFTGDHSALSNLDYASAGHTGFAPISSPALTDVPTAPTAAPGTDTDQLATTSFVQAAVSAATPTRIVGGFC